MNLKLSPAKQGQELFSRKVQMIKSLPYPNLHLKKFRNVIESKLNFSEHLKLVKPKFQKTNETKMLLCQLQTFLF